MRSTPTRALERLLNVPPLYLHLKQKAANTVDRIFNSVHKANWDGISSSSKRGHLFRWKAYLGPELKPIEPVARYNLNSFDVVLDKGETVPNGWCIYTDGSKTVEGVGLGWIIAKDSYLISEGFCKLPDYSSVYEAEVWAIVVALDDLKGLLGSKHGPQLVTILVDNQSALHTINKLKITERVRVNLLDQLEGHETAYKIPKG